MGPIKAKSKKQKTMEQAQSLLQHTHTHIHIHTHTHTYTYTYTYTYTHTYTYTKAYRQSPPPNNELTFFDPPIKRAGERSADVADGQAKACWCGSHVAAAPLTWRARLPAACLRQADRLARKQGGSCWRGHPRGTSIIFVHQEDWRARTRAPTHTQRQKKLGLGFQKLCVCGCSVSICVCVCMCVGEREVLRVSGILLFTCTVCYYNTSV